MKHFEKNILKKLIFSLAALLSAISCNKDGDDLSGIDFKQEMRAFVIGISEYAKAINPDFFIIPQNGIELVTMNGKEDDSLNGLFL